MSKAKNDNLQRKVTTGHSFNAEAKRDYEEGLENLKKFEHHTFGGLSLWLRKAARYFKMAADRYDYADELLGNTLEEYVEDEKK